MPTDTVTVLPSWIWELDVTNDPSSATETWTDITAYVRGATVHRGRQVETGRDQAGTCSLDLDNRDRRFDFFYEGLVGNLVTNPSAEVDLTNYSGQASSISRVSVGAQFGSWEILTTTTNVANSGLSIGETTQIPVTAGLLYTFSVHARRVLAGSTSMQMRIQWRSPDGGSLISNSDATVTLSSTSYSRFSITATCPVGAGMARIRFWTLAPSGVIDFRTDGWMLEQSAALNTYCDGTQAGCHWAGTAHASQSFRTAPYWPNFKPMRRVRGRDAYAAITYPLYYGFLDDPVQTYPDWGADAIVQVGATDGFKILNKKLVSGDFPAQRSDQRIAAILDEIGWPAAARNLAVGVSTLDSITLDKVSALEHIQQVAESESGRFFMAADGDATFIDRHAAYLTTSQATFGEQEINYVDVTFGGGESLIYNEVTVQRAADGSVEQRETGSGSIAEFMTRTLTYSGQHMDSDNEAYDKAVHELTLRQDYHPRIMSMQLDGTYQPSTVWPQALGRELGDRWTVRKRPPGGGLIEQESFIEWIEHRVGVGSWDSSFGLTSVGIDYKIYASGKTFFVLSTSALTSGNGVLVY